MPGHTISSIAIYPPMLRPSQQAVEYVSDWQLFPDDSDDKVLSPSHADTTATAGDSESADYLG